MKIALICTHDWACLSAKFAMSLRAVGCDTESYCLNEHPFDYSVASVVVPIAAMRHVICRADVVIYSHGDATLLSQTSDLLSGKHVAACYTGSAYRKDPQYYNTLFNPIVHLSLTDQTEFMNLGAKNIHYIATAVDATPIAKFGHELKAPYTVGHFPSNPEVKGTTAILKMLSELTIPYILNYSTEIVSHEEQFKRMNACDIYVELFQLALGGKPYGCWGVTAFEAAAAGKVVVTQNVNLHAYERVYGECPMVVCNSEDGFNRSMNSLLALDRMQISEIQTETYEWVKEKHSFESTGKYLKSLL